MTPKQLYLQDIQRGNIVSDPIQQQAIEQLETLYQQLCQQQHSQFAWFKEKFLRQQADSMGGLYLWGGVGIGKTYLMDIFYQSLPFERKQRCHFHQFMAQVHQQLHELQGIAEPLEIIAHQFSKNVTILCLDEFIVEDIADAMLLSQLLKALFAKGVSLVATSNTAPNDLYRTGLQRSRFLPAIALLKEQLKIIHLNSTNDYRTQTLEQKGSYLTPLNDITQQALDDYFNHFSLHEHSHDGPITIANRAITTIKYSHNIIWFDFDAICSSPRSQLDYLEIAKNYSLIIISALTQSTMPKAISYFIKLIDVFYDHRVKLILSADVSIDELYTSGRKLNEFQRTISRLIEMQSEKYWHEEHHV